MLILCEKGRIQCYGEIVLTDPKFWRINKTRFDSISWMKIPTIKTENFNPSVTQAKARKSTACGSGFPKQTFVFLFSLKLSTSVGNIDGFVNIVFSNVETGIETFERGGMRSHPRGLISYLPIKFLYLILRLSSVFRWCTICSEQTQAGCCYLLFSPLFSSHTHRVSVNNLTMLFNKQLNLFLMILWLMVFHVNIFRMKSQDNLKSAEMSCVCVLRPVSVFCVLRYVRCKYNVRRHGQHGIY